VSVHRWVALPSYTVAAGHSDRPPRSLSGNSTAPHRDFDAVPANLMPDVQVHLGGPVMLRGSRAVAVAGATVLVSLIAGATAALADEFTVGILVDSPTSEPPDSSFMEGFQIAVDQSPDVSHPEGVEGGDHLGSIDVVLLVADGGGSEADLVGIVTDMVDGGEVAILVVDLSDEAVETLLALLAEANIMLISMSAGGGNGFPTAVSFFDATGGAQALLTDRTPSFDDTYAAIHNGPPPPSAARGYIAGRLVDIAVEATDRDPFDVSTLAEALATAGVPELAEDGAIGTDNGSPAATAQVQQAPPISPEGQGTPTWVVGGIVAAIAVLLIGAAGFIRRASLSG